MTEGADGNALTLRPIDVAIGVQAFAARTPTLPPATHTNSYALGGRDVLIVEPATPFEDEQRQWLDWCRSLVSKGRHLVAIFLTHHHSDHAGGAETLSRELNLPIWAHAETSSRLPGLHVTRRLEEGDRIVLDGPNAQHWTVLHTPGHAPGHLCLHEELAGPLIAGDMVASVGTILVDTVDGDMQRYIAELERLRARAPRVVLPAHGEPIAAPDALFERYIEHRLMREKKILHALRAFGDDGATASDLVAPVYDDVPGVARRLASMSIAAHLVKLVREGRATTDGNRHRASTDVLERAPA